MLFLQFLLFYLKGKAHSSKFIKVCICRESVVCFIFLICLKTAHVSNNTTYIDGNLRNKIRQDSI